MTDNAVRIEPFFLDGPNGQLFCVYTAPNDAPLRAAVLHLPAFAEEMHKSRRMVALTARALARRGIAVLQVDLTGCGDSGGDFGDASWAAWLADARAAHTWLTDAARAPVSLWGLRTGALLAADLARDLPDAPGLLLWQPVADGSLFLNQFLRIRLASEMLSDGQAKNGTRRLLDALAAGEDVEVGGYLLSPVLARDLGQLKLAAMPPPGPLAWLETAASGATGVTPASLRVIDRWQAHGANVETAVVAGDPFWTTQEISVCPALIDLTLECLDREPVALA